MKKHIEGIINGNEFTSSEPLAIGLKYIEMFPENKVIGAQIVNWAWEQLVDKTTTKKTFKEQGIEMWTVVDETVDVLDIQAGLGLIKEIGGLQASYKKLLTDGKMTKKAMCDLVIPFRDKYRLTDIDALSIARNEKSFNEVAKILEKSFE